jgi:hypothetical protein
MRSQSVNYERSNKYYNVTVEIFNDVAVILCYVTVCYYFAILYYDRTYVMVYCAFCALCVVATYFFIFPFCFVY